MIILLGETFLPQELASIRMLKASAWESPWRTPSENEARTMRYEKKETEMDHIF